MRPPLPSALATDLACSMAVGRSGCLCASAKCQVPSAPRSRGPPRAPGPRPRARPPPTRSSKSATVSSRALCRPHSPASGGLFAARSAISTTASSRASRVSAASPEGLGALCKRPSRGPAFQPQGAAVTHQRPEASSMQLHGKEEAAADASRPPPGARSTTASSRADDARCPKMTTLARPRTLT